MAKTSEGSVITIESPQRERTKGGERITFPVVGLDPPYLWFEVSEAGAPLLDDSLDAAVVTLLIPAMVRSLSLRVEGPMSARLAWNLLNTVIPVVDRMIPLARPIKLHTPELRTGHPESGWAVGTGFSRGVDSLAALVDHFLVPKVPREERLTHLVFMHIGHHGYGADLEERVAKRWGQTKAAAEEIGLPLIRVDSNAPDFYPPEHDSPLSWASTLPVRTASVPLLLQRGMRRYLLGSSFSWEFISVRPHRHMSIADPILFPALSTENLELACVGTELTRVEKTRLIAHQELARRYLDVCTMDAGVNCSRCEKCLRTLFTLELLGAADDFEDRFDVDVFARAKSAFVARLLAGRSLMLHREITELMAEKGYRPPLKVRFLALALRLWRLVPWNLRRRFRGGARRGLLPGEGAPP